MTRPSFSVGAATVSLLVLFGVCRRTLGPLIPGANPAPPGATLFERAGADQAIAWRSFATREGEEVAREESRRRGVPILLFLGRTSSPAARSLDTALGDAEIARLISSRFVPARLDLLRRPEWTSALFPLARTAAWMDPGCQLIVLDPTGRPVAALQVTALDRLPNRDEVGALMEFAGGEIARVAGRSEIPYDAERRRMDEAAFADRKALETLDPGARIESGTGLVVAPGGAYASPEAIETLARAGRLEEARTALRWLASSRMADPISGGVFGRRGGPPEGTGSRIETTDLLARDAAFAELAARLSEGARDLELAAFSDSLAENAFRRFVRRDPEAGEGRGGAPTGFVSDVGPDGYSATKSLTFGRLGGVGLSEDAAAIRRVFEADGGQALGRRTAASASSPLARRAITRLRDGDSAVEARGILRSDATVIARLLGAARLRRNESRVAQLLRLLAELEGAVPARDDERTLETDLARADAAFAAFLAAGKPRDLERAARLLEGSRQALRIVPEGSVLAPGPPALADEEGEAPMASAIRLADAVGRTLSGAFASRRRGDRLVLLASDLAATSERRLLGRGPEVAGMLNALDALRRPKATSAARDPFALVLPSGAPVFDELRMNAP